MSQTALSVLIKHFFFIDFFFTIDTGLGVKLRERKEKILPATSA